MGPMAKIMYHLSNPKLYLSDNLYPSQYDPNSLQYMLEFFRTVAQTIPASPPSPTTSPDHPAEAVPIEPMHGSARDMLQDRAGIIVLREDLDFYAIPPRRDITQPEMIEVKRAAGEALLRQDGIFSGLRKSEEPGTTEQHLIEMLTAGYVSFASAAGSCLLTRAVASTTTTAGVTAPANPTRPSSAVLHSHA
jgi:ATP-binding cassette subfamily F protein 3